MKIKNKRIIVLFVILGLLLLGWWGFYPLELTCELYNTAHNHSIFYPTKRDAHFDYIEYILEKPSEFSLLHQLSSGKYSIKTISNLIQNKRYAHNEYDIDPDTDWIDLLIMIGHYEEAEQYLKKFKHNIAIDLEYVNMGCSHASEPVNRFKMLACKLINSVIVLTNTKATNYSYDGAIYYQNAYVNIRKVKGPFWRRAKIEFKKTPLAFCPENYDRSKIRKGRKGVSYHDDTGLQFCGSHSYLTYLIQENKLEQTNKYLKLYEKQYGDKADFELNYYRYWLAMSYYEKHQYAKAIPLFKKVLEYQDYNYFANEKIAECYRKIGNIKQAQYYENIMKELLAL